MNRSAGRGRGGGGGRGGGRGSARGGRGRSFREEGPPAEIVGKLISFFCKDLPIVNGVCIPLTQQ